MRAWLQRAHLEPGDLLGGLVGKLVNSSGPSVGGVGIDGIDVGQVGGKHAGAVKQFLHAVVGATESGHEAAELLGDDGLWGGHA